jgi:proline iminopeptidase
MSNKAKVIEGKVAVPGGEVWYRRMGSGGVPLILIHGGPGYPCDILFPAFEALASEREVIWYDQLGVGKSDPVEDPSLLVVDRYLDELAAVINGLGLQRPHVYGHSWGGMLNLQYAAERAPDWTSLIAASPLASAQRFSHECRLLMSQMPGDVLERVYGRELAGKIDDPDFMAAQMEFMRVHILRNPNPPVEIDLAKASYITFRTLLGHGDYNITGNLKDWDIFDELHKIRVPTLIIGGEFDYTAPSHLFDIAARIPGAEHVTQRGCAHMAYLEAEPIRNEHIAIIRDFMSGAEARLSTKRA